MNDVHQLAADQCSQIMRIWQDNTIQEMMTGITKEHKLLAEFWDWMHDELEHHCLCDSKHDNFKEALDKFLMERNNVSIS